ncbi:hypothetical protein, partial [Xanthomonas perforans]|uniref:hypothetical protein n=1 Tax=Xanthomonas perforans TaxID=442694 RepID=UPI001C97F0EE
IGSLPSASQQGCGVSAECLRWPRLAGQVNLLVDDVRFAWPMSGPDAGKAVGLGFDHRAEVVVAQSSLLL